MAFGIFVHVLTSIPRSPRFLLPVYNAKLNRLVQTWWFCAHAVTSQCGSKARCCPASEYSVSVFMICCSTAMSRFSEFFWDQMECWKILRAKQLQPKFKGAWSKFAFDTGSDPTWRGTALGWSFWQRQAVQLLATNGWFAPDRCFGIFSGLFDSQASRPIPGGLCFCRAPMDAILVLWTPVKRDWRKCSNKRKLLVISKQTKRTKVQRNQEPSSSTIMLCTCNHFSCILLKHVQLFVCCVCMVPKIIIVLSQWKTA